ncbi:hypothetical protein L7F22_060547 [Adiantum nelumboides]|nr:hypothetical protein [Adiantum nelumboides]
MFFVKESKQDACVSRKSCRETKEELELSNLTNAFQDVFTDDNPRELPPTREQDDHTIELLPSSSPPNKPPYRVSQAQQEEFMRQVNELVEKDMSNSNIRQMAISQSSVICASISSVVALADRATARLLNHVQLDTTICLYGIFRMLIEVD